MDFSWGAFRLPRPWSRPQSDDKQPSETSDDSPALRYDNGQPALDVSYGSHDDENFAGLSTQEQLSKLRDVQEELLNAWASVCPDDRAEIQRLGNIFYRLGESRSIQAETQPNIATTQISPDEYPRMEARSDRGLGSYRQNQGAQRASGDERHDSEYPSSEPDIGPQSINTPSLRDAQVDMNYIPTTAGTLTSHTFTCTVSQPQMSTHVKSHTNVPVSGAGTPVDEETSLYGRIWVPITHSTPRFSQAGDRFVAETEGAGSQMVHNPSDWRLVCSDQSSGPSGYAGDVQGRPTPQGNPPLTNPAEHVRLSNTRVPSVDRNAISPPSFESWMGEMEPVFRQAFEAGKSWAEHHYPAQREPQRVSRGQAIGERSTMGDGERRSSEYTGNDDFSQHTHVKTRFVSSQADAPGLPWGEAQWATRVPQVHFSDSVPYSAAGSRFGVSQVDRAGIPYDMSRAASHMPQVHFDDAGSRFGASQRRVPSVEAYSLSQVPEGSVDDGVSRSVSRSRVAVSQVDRAGLFSDVGQSVSRVPQVDCEDTMPPAVSGPGSSTAKRVVETKSGVSQNVATTHAIRPKKVAKYDGKTSWADYLVQFNIASRLNAWDDDQKAMELATSLEGNARGVLADLTPEHQLDFKVLVDKLTQRFEPEGQVGIYQSQLRNRKRKRNETIPELVQKISCLARKAYPAADEQTRSHMAISSFISALGNEAQELFVYQKDPQTLDEAGRSALSFETFQAARGKDTPYVRVQQPEKSSGGPPQWAREWMAKIESIEKKVSNWSKQSDKGRGKTPGNTRSGNRRTGACHHCGQEGHWIRECPSWGTQGANQDKGQSESETKEASAGLLDANHNSEQVN